MSSTTKSAGCLAEPGIQLQKSIIANYSSTCRKVDILEAGGYNCIHSATSMAPAKPRCTQQGCTKYLRLKFTPYAVEGKGFTKWVGILQGDFKRGKV
jgi:hypothetical protein